jgi:hypothetical protein
MRPGQALFVVGDRPLTGRAEAGVGGMQVQRAPAFHRRRVAIGLDHHELDPLVDRIGGKLRWRIELGAHSECGIGTVHNHFVQPPANPPAGRSRSQERPHPGVWSHLIDSADDLLGATVEPVDRAVLIVGRFAVAHTARFEGLAAALGDDLSRPPVAAPDVTEQLPHRPVGTGRHRCRRVYTSDQLTEGMGLVEQGGSEIHVTNLQRCAPCQV